KLMKDLLKDKKISKKSYKMLYRKTKGGFFRSRAHLRAYVERELKRIEK
ncbi:50S ribosomal protein L19e, partial [Candidatus Woesearchaeota archaeon]|nr:50S ribosomal protein L19e [Candidatus Woesearchaeota archaeon]